MPQEAITERSFRETVKRRVESEGMSFVRAVYQTLDDFLETERQNSGIALACQRGCSTCCHQLITCTEMEIDETVIFVRSMPRPTRLLLKRQLHKAAKNWMTYYRKNEPILTRSAFPLQVHRDWLGRPCPFLNQVGGFCSIYPVRIIDCRTLTSVIPCTAGAKEASHFRFQSEPWANNIILDEQRDRIDTMAITPIHHWINLKDF